MELKEVLDRATERPWGILYPAEHSEAPWWIVGHLGNQPRTVCKLVQIGHEANGILISHAVNKLEGLFEAAKGMLIWGEPSERHTYGKEGCPCGWHVAWRKMREAIRRAEEVSP